MNSSPGSRLVGLILWTLLASLTPGCVAIPINIPANGDTGSQSTSSADILPSYTAHDAGLRHDSRPRHDFSRPSWDKENMGSCSAVGAPPDACVRDGGPSDAIPEGCGHPSDAGSGEQQPLDGQQGK